MSSRGDLGAQLAAAGREHARNWLRPTHVPPEVTHSQFRETNFGEQRDIRGLSAAQTVI